MNIKINRKELIETINKLQTTTKENKIRPILSSIKITANDKIIFQATDLENTLIVEVEGSIEEVGSIAVECSEVLEYIKELSDEELNLEVLENMLYIKSDSGGIGVSLYDVDEFPKIIINDTEKKINIDAEKLLRSISKASICFPKDNSNLSIAGLRVICKDNKIKISSTDTYRAATYSEEFETMEEFEMTIPISSVKNIEKYLKGVNGEIELGLNGNNCIMVFENNKFMFRCIDLAFPDIDGIEENFEYDQKIDINPLKFIPYLKRIRSIVKNNVEMKNGAIFLFGEKELKIKAVSDKAKATEKVKDINGLKEMEVGLNVEFLLQYMNHCNIFTLYLNNKDSMLKLEDGNYKYFLMPLAMK